MQAFEEIHYLAKENSILWGSLGLFPAQSRKIKEIYSKKISYIFSKFFFIFWETKFKKNFLIFFQKKTFLIFQEIELSSLKIKNSWEGTTFWEWKIKKYSLQKNFFYFGKWHFLAANLKSPFIFSYVSGENL